MKIMKKRGKTPKEIRPIVVDDYIYNDPEDSGPADSVSSDTPDEAIRKLRGRSAKEPPESSEAKEKDEKETASSRVFSSGIMLDENLQPVETAERRSRRKHRRLRTAALATAAVILILGLGAFIFQRTSGAPLFGSEDSLVSRLISPVQSVFAGIADSFGGFFREIFYVIEPLVNKHGSVADKLGVPDVKRILKRQQSPLEASKAIVVTSVDNAVGGHLLFVSSPLQESVAINIILETTL